MKQRRARLDDSDEEEEVVMKSDSDEESRDGKPSRKTRRQALHSHWAEKGYVSTSLPMPGADELEEVKESEEQLIHLSGDATNPQRRGEDESTEQIIAHVVDDSGTFGRGGMFTAINNKFPSVAARYELISEMKDMKVGDVHLVDVTEDNGKENDEASTTGEKGRLTLALLIAQHADNREEIQTELLKTCLRKLAHYSLTVGHKVSVHFARLGTGMEAFERLAHKHLCSYGVPTYLYRYTKEKRSPRGSPKKRRHSSPDTGRKPRRAAVNAAKKTKIVDDDFSDEDSMSEDSSEASDSEDEYDPDAEDGDKKKKNDEDDEDESGSDEDSSEDDEDESEEDFEDEVSDIDEEEEEQPKKRRPPPTNCRVTSKPTGQSAAVKRPASKSPSKEDEQSTSQQNGSKEFANDVISLLELERKRVSDYGEFKTLVEETGGSVVEDAEDESTLKKVNICVVPKALRNDKDRVSTLRKELSKNAKIVTEMWITECSLYEKRTDPNKYAL